MRVGGQDNSRSRSGSLTRGNLKQFLSVSLILVLSRAGYAQTVTPAVLKSGDLEADAAILRSAYEQLHPGLYRYSTKSEMDADFDALKIELGHDQTLQEAFVAFSQFAAKVRCGHTQANPFNQSKALVDTLFKSQTRLPFYFDWLGGRMIVTRDFTPGHVLPAGTEVVEVNGVRAAKVLATLLSVARADGGNESKRVAQLAVNGESSYETFDLYYPMFFPQKSTTDTLLVRKPKTQRPIKITVESLTFEQRIAPIKQREQQSKGGSDALFEWTYLADGSASLRMPTWALYDSKWNWKQWLDDHLNEAAERNAPALILDVRGNEGGDDVGSQIIPHLIDTPKTVSTMQRLVRYRKVPEDLVPYLDTWDKSFRDWGASAVDLPSPWPTAPAAVSYFKLARHDDDAAGDVLRPKGTRFHGKVFVLIDAINSSATFQFAQNMQRQHLGTLVGEPTGGSQRGINGGAFFFLRLPHSGIEMDLPLIGTFSPEPAPDKGVTPDVLVTQSPEDIGSGRDAGMAAVVRLLKP
jgi:C-terminal processing protease CtpA/Prc